MHLLNIKLRTLQKLITILYDDKKPLEVYDSLDGLVDVDGVHGGVDLLRLEQNDHGHTSPFLGRGVVVGHADVGVELHLDLGNLEMMRKYSTLW